LPDGASLTINRVGATALIVNPSPIPEQLLGLAQWSTGQARRPDADATPTLLAIIMIVTAAEAIVNSLLEFVLPPKTWNGTDGKRDGYQWRTLDAKFARLSQLISMKPALDKTKSPLREFLAVAEIRNQLIHFQYGPNIRQVAVGADASYEGGRVRVEMPEPEPDPEAPGQILHEAKLLEPLKPDKASGYYAALENLLRPVLGAYPSDPLGTVTRLKETLEKRDFLDGQAASAATDPAP
jgi:hypothetical protein